MKSSITGKGAIVIGIAAGMATVGGILGAVTRQAEPVVLVVVGTLVALLPLLEEKKTTLCKEKK